MATLGPAEARTFPNFERWLIGEFVKVKFKPRVMNAFWKWSDFSPSDENIAYFNYGTDPIINVYGDLDSFGCRYDFSDDNGPPKGPLTGVKWSKTWDKGHINLWSALVVLVDEQLRKPQRERDVNDRQLLEFIESTIVHELVHWSYYANKDDEPTEIGSDKKPHTIEVGNRFELDAYGHYMDLDWHLFCVEQETQPAFLGLQISKKQYACVVQNVLDWSPAFYAGILAGDTIVQFDGQIVGTDKDFDAAIAKKSPGETAKVHVMRLGQSLELTVLYPLNRSDFAAQSYGFK